MQILALTSRTPENQKELASAIESYRKMLFPGIEREKDESMERAKRALAEETKKVYMVRRLDSVQDLRASIQKAQAAGAPELAKAAVAELKKKEQAENRVRQRLKKTGPKN